MLAATGCCAADTLFVTVEEGVTVVSDPGGLTDGTGRLAADDCVAAASTAAADCDTADWLTEVDCVARRD